MNELPENAAALERIEQEAAAWVLREDRGLSAEEQDAFTEWLAADARHGAQLARFRRHWRRADGLAEWRPEHGARPNPDLLAPPLRRRVGRFAPVALLLAAAAALAVIFLWPRKAPPDTAAALATPPAAPNQRVLPDGTVVELNRGAVLTTQFTGQERRVTLASGEAHFAVKKDPARPFIVRAGGADVRAVGTAFNIRIDPASVEVLVTEGRVQLDPRPPAAVAPAAVSTAPAAAGSAPNSNASAPSPSLPLSPPAILEARQRAVISLAPTPEAPAPQIATLTAGEIERVLAWQHRVLDFNATPLTEIVAELNRRNVAQLVVIDPELATVRVSATVRTDNLDGFVRMLELGFGVRAERRGETEILLRANR